MVDEDKNVEIEKHDGHAEPTKEEERLERRLARLRAIMELKDEGFSDEGVGARLNLDAASVRGIREAYLRSINQQPVVLRSSLARSLENHTPEPHVIERIETFRGKADELCQLMDYMCRDNPREMVLAKTHLEETVMWAVKAMVLPEPPANMVSDPNITTVRYKSSNNPI